MKTSHDIDVNIVADEDMFIPTYETEEAACCDLYVNLKVAPEVDGMPVSMSNPNTFVLAHRKTALLDCGFSMKLPVGWKANISLRSGFSKKGVVLNNAPGRIDSDYVGRLKLIICNVGNQTISINHGQRIAQMEIQPVFKLVFCKKDSLPETKRGTGGLGSTGE